MFGLGEDTLLVLVAILAVFGPAFYFIYMVGKLIKYRIDKKYSSSNSGELQEMREFRQRTERRLRALEEIIAEQDDERPDRFETIPRPEKSSQEPPDEERPAEEKTDSGAKNTAAEEPAEKAQNSRLPNQLKS